MRSGYDKADDSELIKKYENDHACKVIITHLDGSKTELTYSNPVEERKLLNELSSKMLDQAKERDAEVYGSRFLVTERDNGIKNTISSAIFTFILSGMYQQQVNKETIPSMILLGITAAVGITIVINAHEYVVCEKRIGEIDKYHLYLENKELIDGLSTKDKTVKGIVVDINTLDSISINDLVNVVKKGKSRQA